MSSDPHIARMRIARALGQNLGERFAAGLQPPFDDEIIAEAAARIVEAVIGEFRDRDGADAAEAAVLGREAGINFLQAIERIEAASRTRH